MHLYNLAESEAVRNKKSHSIPNVSPGLPPSHIHLLQFSSPKAKLKQSKNKPYTCLAMICRDLSLSLLPYAPKQVPASTSGVPVP